MQYKDYYEILGVTRGAEAEAVKRRTASSHASFTRTSAGKEREEKFKEVQEAYEVLRDPEKRGLRSTRRTIGRGSNFGRSGLVQRFGQGGGSSGFPI